MKSPLGWALAYAALVWAACGQAVEANAGLLAPADIIQLTDNGAWSWFMDPRAIVDRGRLIVGSVRANGRFADTNLPGWGNVELTILDLKFRSITRSSRLYIRPMRLTWTPCRRASRSWLPSAI